MFLNDYGHYRNVNQLRFDTIPSCPIAYWLSINWLKLFGKQSINDIAISKAGIVSGDDNYFVKYWHEVCFKDISFLPQKPYAKFHTFQKVVQIVSIMEITIMYLNLRTCGMINSITNLLEEVTKIHISKKL